MLKIKELKRRKISKKYGVRYGSRLRKNINVIEIQQKAKYICAACGKKTVRRKAVGIWKCRKCRHTFAGGAYTPSTIKSVSDIVKAKK